MKKRGYNIESLSQNKFIIISLLSLLLFFLLMAMFRHTIIPNNQKNLTENNQYYHNNPNQTGNLLISKSSTFKERVREPIMDGPESIMGDKNAPISIIEFSDFECKFCAKQEGILKTIIDTYGDKIKLIWKDYPENNPNSSSYQAAVAGRCAEEQNKFWEYHNILYQESHNLNKKTFLEIAEELNLDENKFEQCLSSETAKGLVDNNIKEANDLDIPGIPFTYINKLEIIGEATLEEIKNIIELELEKTK